MIEDIHRPSFHDDKAAIWRGLAGSMNGSDANVCDLERDLMTYFNVKSCVATQSCTTAIMASLHSVGVGPGDLVAMPPTGPLCTAYSVLAMRAQPLFVDTRTNNFGLLIDDLKKVLRDYAVSAVVEIPMWGIPTQMDELADVASAFNVPLVADLAHCHGTRLNDKHLCSFPTVSCFSMHERKILSTGEGGFLTTDDDELSMRCRSFRQNGYLNGVDFGINAKLGAVQAELGRSRLAHLEQQILTRRANASALIDSLNAKFVRPLPIVPGGKGNGYSLVLEIMSEAPGDFVEYQMAHGVPSDIARYGIKCLYEYPVLSSFRRECPNASALLSRITTIPTHPGLTSDELAYMSDVINQFNPRSKA